MLFWPKTGFAIGSLFVWPKKILDVKNSKSLNKLCLSVSTVDKEQNCDTNQITSLAKHPLHTP